MLISFKVSNFLSFKEETEFSMVAGKERIHPHHVIKGKKNQPNLLRAALLYGANAAGKSNFAKAIAYSTELITNSLITSNKYRRGWVRDYLLAGSIFNSKFKLNKNYLNKPSSFVFEFISNNKIYEYGFKINNEVIIEEWLYELSQGFKRLFNRSANKFIADNEKSSIKKADIDFLNFVKRSVAPNKLFLTHGIENNVEWFNDAYKWFRDSLTIVFPDSVDFDISQKIKEYNQYGDFLTKILSKAGTGISKVYVEEIKKKVPVHVSKDFALKVFAGKEPRPLYVEEEESKLKITHNENIDFHMHEESDGTRRLFDLAFPFYDLVTSETPKVYIIDELERNLHTNLSYMLLKSYLEQEGKGQLIATTHDTHLLDLDLLRRDEIWFAEKDEHGATQLYSLYDFNPRYDKKIEKEYLTGRFGAIPFLGNLEFKRRLAKNGKSKNNGES